ncbi:MAG: hypothetical protein U0892_06940 [Pirellulales bacterium]
MIYHGEMVTRGAQRAMVAVDLPFARPARAQGHTQDRREDREADPVPCRETRRRR